MVENNLMTPKEYVKEFIRVLRVELDELKDSPNNNIALKNGKLEEEESRYVYRFDAERAFLPSDNEEYIIITDEESHPCELISVSGNQIVLKVSDPISIDREINLYIDRTALPEKLLQRFQETLPDADRRYAYAARIFNGQFHRDNLLEPDLSGYEQINEYQKDAVIHSCQGDTIIWGPPGTGKTHTIAVAINEQIKRGRRVLLLSHANTAVDGAMEELAALLKNTAVYSEGRLIRIGHSQLDEYPMVSLEYIVREKTEELENQIVEIEIQIQSQQIQYAALIKIQSLWEECLQRRSACNQKVKAYTQRYEEIKRFRGEIMRRENVLQDRSAALSRLKNKLFQTKRVRLKIQRVEWEISENKRFITQARGYIEQLCAQRSTLYSEINDLKEQIENAEREVRVALLNEGLSFQTLRKEVERLTTKIKEAEQQINKKRSEILSLEEDVMKRALVVGATLSKTFMSADLCNQKFDVLFVDEISMSPLLPMFFALGMISCSCTLIGDFLQLPPIGSQSKAPLLQKWQDRSFFEIININTVSQARNSTFVKALSIQYRMNPHIADVSNELFYEGILKSGEITKKRVLYDEWVQEKPLVLIDTSSAEPWMSSGPNGQSRYNLPHAILAAEMAYKYLGCQTADGKSITVGVVVPYKAQKDLINDILDGRLGKNSSERNRIGVNTVHSFQGGEKDVIICDSVESEGLKRSWFFFDEGCPKNQSAQQMLNVAITRAKCKFVLLANVNYVKRYFKGKCFSDLLKILRERGVGLDSSELGIDFKTEDEEKILEQLKEGMVLGHHNQNSFWANVIPDLQGARKRIVIFCPFVREGRIRYLIPVFKKAIETGAQVIVYTRSIKEHEKTYQNTARSLINMLRQEGIVVRIREKCTRR